MNFFKAMRFRLSQKLKIDGTDPENNQMPWEELKDGSMKPVQKIGAADESSEEEYDEDDDDDENHEDFGSNVVKRRLMETRKNSFMVLIPEESNLEEEEETSSSEWRELEVEDGYPWSEFDTLYIRYCERMLFFVQSMKEADLKLRMFWEAFMWIYAQNLIYVMYIGCGFQVQETNLSNLG